MIKLSVSNVSDALEYSPMWVRQLVYNGVLQRDPSGNIVLQSVENFLDNRIAQHKAEVESYQSKKNYIQKLVGAYNG